MNNPKLAAGAATALAASLVAAPVAHADTARDLVNTAEAVIDLSSVLEDAGSSVGGSEGSSEMSNEAVTGLAITLAVLGLIGGGAYVAVTNGFITLPDEIAQLGYDMGIPGIYPNRGSCHPSEFDRLINGWPGPRGTAVTYCDGKWARAAMRQSDWIQYFYFQDGKWRVLKPDGSSLPADYPCYNGYKVREMGAPEEIINRMLICRPNEIRR